MKRIGIFLILIFLLVRDIYSIKVCFPEKYRKYDGIFNRTLSNDDIYIEYFPKMDNYISGLTLNQCNVAMMEPIIYDEFFPQLADIYDLIKDEIEIRKKDPVDGEIYGDLIRDLRASEVREDGKTKIKVTTRALPLFMDYGILYYRSDLVPKSIETWEQLLLIPEELSNYNKDVHEYTIYIGQYNEYREFYYNLIESILSTKDEINYDVMEREAKYILSQYRELNHQEIIESSTWTMNSESSVDSYNEGKVIFMRNWSSYMKEIKEHFNNSTILISEGATVGMSKILHSEKNGISKTVNKGYYLGVVKSEDKNTIAKSVEIIKKLTSKEYMKNLVKENEFYDILPYKSFLTENVSLNNTDYCNRINCSFFRELQNNQEVAAYDVIINKNEFRERMKGFYNEFKKYFIGPETTTEVRDGDEEGIENEYTIEALMTKFSNFFKDKYIEYGSTVSHIIIIVIGVEILITAVVAFFIIKYRNFIEIRRSSPLFLILMLLGIILAFASIFTFIGKPNNYICIIKPYVFVLAFGLTFYSLLLKTFRIKVIFDKVNIKVKDFNLIVYLCIVLGLELVVVTIWNVFYGMVPSVKDVNNEIHYYTCQNTSTIGTYIEIFLVAINGLALLYGCYLAYKVKNVYSEYNESKVIGLSIYGIVICMVILIFIINIPGLDLTTLFLIESLMIILSADIILVFMFTPKLWKLHINVSEMTYQKPLYI